MTQHDKEFYKIVTDKVINSISEHENILSGELNNLIRKIGAHYSQKKRDNISDYIDEFVALLLAAILKRINESVSFATETEDNAIPIGDIKIRSRLFSEQSYEDSVKKVKEIFTKEVEYFVALDMPFSMIGTYMSNPLGFLSAHKQDISAFRRYVNAGSGYSYKTRANILTIISFASMTAYNLALTELWAMRGDVIGYMGYRGSNFYCPDCDSACSVIHPLGTNVFPVHVRCCCIVVPVFMQ